MISPKHGDPLVRLIHGSEEQADARGLAEEHDTVAANISATGGPGGQRGRRACASEGRRVPADERQDRMPRSGEKKAPSTEDGAGATARAVLLDELTPAIESARIFAERWNEIYRPYVFRAALDRLIGLPTGAASNIRVAGAGTSSPSNVRLPSAGATGIRPHDTGTDQKDAYEKLARALVHDIDTVERLVEFGDEGKLHILARIAGTTRKELQTKYSLAYLYVKEVALGERMVDIGELRALCIEHACYDMANFTGNFNKDVTAGLLRQQGERGARSRKFLLSKKGLDAGAALLRELAVQ